MKQLILVLALLAWTAPAAAQIPLYRLGQGVETLWDYTDVQVTEGAVTRFEVQLDANPRVDSGLPPLPPGTYIYPLPQTQLTAGVHTVRIWACNDLGACSASAAETTFRVVAPPATPSSPRTRPIPGAALNLDEAFTLANAYAYVGRALAGIPLRSLTAAELSTLGAAYDGPFPPRVTPVLDTLDANLAVWLK